MPREHCRGRGFEHPVTNEREVLTVGHSNHPFGDLLALLRQHRVAVVADVRSVPYSRRNPQFRRPGLERSLGEHGIRYVFLGAELGARTQDPSCYDEDGRVQYSKLARTEVFLRGIERVLDEAAGARLALLCAERDPANCHRTILVAPALVERGVTVAHILADGVLASQDEVLDRLCAARGMPPRDMFRTREEQRREALVRRGREIAWLDPARVRIRAR